MTIIERYNNEAGTLGAALTSTGTTITFTNVPDFATLTGPEYIKIAIDSGTDTYEIVYLVAYNSGSNTGTIVRSGTSPNVEDAINWPAVAHQSGAPWACVPTVADFNSYVTTSEVDAAGGVAPLDSNSLVPLANLPIDPTALIIPGVGAPGPTTGFNGDGYLDQASGNFYYPKTGGTWGSSTQTFLSGAGALNAYWPTSGALNLTGTTIPLATISSIGTGTWLVTASCLIEFTGGAATSSSVDIGCVLGTATGSLLGQTASTMFYQLATGGTDIFPFYQSTMTFIATITSTGSIVLQYRATGSASGIVKSSADQAPSGATITGVTNSGTAVTFTCSNSFTAGELVTVAGVTGFTTNNPNGTWTVLNTGLSGSQFEAIVTSAPTGSWVSGGTATPSFGLTTGITAYQLQI